MEKACGELEAIAYYDMIAAFRFMGHLTYMKQPFKKNQETKCKKKIKQKTKIGVCRG